MCALGENVKSDEASLTLLTVRSSRFVLSDPRELHDEIEDVASSLTNLQKCCASRERDHSRLSLPNSGGLGALDEAYVVEASPVTIGDGEHANKVAHALRVTIALKFT